jgi:hypothetical protein
MFYIFFVSTRSGVLYIGIACSLASSGLLPGWVYLCTLQNNNVSLDHIIYIETKTDNKNHGGKRRTASANNKTLQIIKFYYMSAIFLFGCLVLVAMGSNQVVSTRIKLLTYCFHHHPHSILPRHRSLHQNMLRLKHRDFSYLDLGNLQLLIRNHIWSSSQRARFILQSLLSESCLVFTQVTAHILLYLWASRAQCRHADPHIFQSRPRQTHFLR